MVIRLTEAIAADCFILIRFASKRESFGKKSTGVMREHNTG